MADGKLQISVIICSYNRADYIINALESLYHQTLSKEAFEVFVVDNNSTDNTGDLVHDYIKGHPSFHLQYVTETNQGSSYARNTGAARATSPLLCFMDDDATADKEYLQKIVAFFERHPDAVGLGGRIIPNYIPAKPEWMSYYVSSMVGNFDYSPIVTAFKPGKYPLESNMVVRKKDFDAIGAFNTNLPGVKGTLRIGGEGKDFFFRLQEKGGTIYYDPSLVVYHVVEVKKLTPGYLYRVASGYGRGERVRIREKGRGAFYTKVLEYLFKLGAAAIIGLFYAVKGKPAQTWPLIKFRIDALKGLLEKQV